MKKKVISILLSVVLILSLLSFSASAGDWSSKSKTFANLGHTSFSTRWTDRTTVTVGGYKYDFVYGYDVFATPEDYVKNVQAQSDNNTKYYAVIKNGDSITDMTNTATHTTATGKADVRHSGSNVTITVYAASI